MSAVKLDSSYPRYNDGLDADGYPLKVDTRLRYRHGCEEDAGDRQPLHIGDVFAQFAQQCEIHIRCGAGACDSPIETILAGVVLVFFERAGKPLKLCRPNLIKEAPSGLLLVPQFAWSYYRSDWAVLDNTRTGALLIECDGKAFHSSPEQKAHDAKKDTAARDYGYLTMRFTGSQIHRDARGCVQKIFDAVCGL